MRRRMAFAIFAREDRGRWVPRRASRWAFDYLFAHGEPVEVRRTRVRVVHAHPLMEVNPPPRTWATTTANPLGYTTTSTIGPLT